MRSIRSVTPFLAAACVLAATVAAHAKLAGASDAEVTFFATGPAGLRIEGKGNEVRVADDGATVTVVVPLAGFRTGIGLRDQHMRDKYLEVAKFPNAELTVVRAALKFPAGGATQGEAPATVVVKGKAKAVTLRYGAAREGAGIRVTGDLDLDMRDFGIEVPSYLGVTVKPAVTVKARFLTTDAG